MKVLLVEDSPRLQRALAVGLRRTGFVVDVAGDGREGLWRAQSGEYTVVILDLMLPLLDGMSLLATLRSKSTETRVLILSAKDAVSDRVKGLEAGADDYLTKPFAFTELVARVKALSRRRYDTTDTRLAIADLEIDLSCKQVRRAGRAIELTRHEFMLLEYLALRRGRVVTRQEIEEQLYDDRRDPLSNVVDAAVCRLRRKIDGPADPPLIHTRRGLGYVLGSSPS